MWGIKYWGHPCIWFSFQVTYPIRPVKLLLEIFELVKTCLAYSPLSSRSRKLMYVNVFPKSISILESVYSFPNEHINKWWNIKKLMAFLVVIIVWLLDVIHQYFTLIRYQSIAVMFLFLDSFPLTTHNLKTHNIVVHIFRYKILSLSQHPQLKPFKTYFFYS